ncbi:hypothetical protein MKEN_01425900 [Mycena kentingensis (nom. inval.)]|nr:hypothetical protein MKEN_01425900 [Mycena kentingensis (nom. inval.)]
MPPELPTELWLHIGLYASRQSLGRLCSVSRQLFHIFVHPLYNAILDLNEKQSSRLVQTLRTAKNPDWRQHPAEIITQLTLTDEDGLSRCPTTSITDAMKNLARCVPGGVGSPLRVLHWSVSSCTSRLGQLLLEPGHFPNLKELYVATDESTHNLLFMHKPGLEVFSLKLELTFTDDEGMESLLYKLGEAMQRLPFTSPLLHTLQLRVLISIDGGMLPSNGCTDLAVSMEDAHFPALQKLDLSIEFEPEYEEEDELQDLDFDAFLLSHRNLVDLSLEVTGTTICEDVALLANLHSFKGFPDAADTLLSYRPKRLDSLHLSLLHNWNSSHGISTYCIPEYPTYANLESLTITAVCADGTTLKQPDSVRPETLEALAASFPNLKHLDTCLSNFVTEYNFALFKQLERLRVREYRRRLIRRKPLDKVFTPARYRKVAESLAPVLLWLSSVEMTILADDREGCETCTCGTCPSYRNADHELEEEDDLAQPADIEVEHRFEIVRREAAPEVVYLGSNYAPLLYNL